MLNIRKYMDGAVTETPFNSNQSQPITESVKLLAGNALIASEQTNVGEVEVNNAYIMKEMRTGIVYKNSRQRVEVAFLGSHVTRMPLLLRDNSFYNTARGVGFVKLATPDLVIVHRSGDTGVCIYDHENERSTFNPFTNVFDSHVSYNVPLENGSYKEFRGGYLCKGSTLDSKVDSEFSSGKYTALQMLSDILATRPNQDLSFHRNFRPRLFEAYMRDALRNEAITKEQVIAIRDAWVRISLSTSGLSPDSERIVEVNGAIICENNSYVREYNFMLTLAAAITEVAPNIAGRFMAESFEYEDCAGARNLGSRSEQVMETLTAMGS